MATKAVSQRGSSRPAPKSKAPAPRRPRGGTVARWGNSLGVRIPQDVAEQLKLKAGQQVTFQVERDAITIRAARKKWSEAELLAGATPETAGGEIDWGGPVGREVW